MATQEDGKQLCRRAAALRTKYRVCEVRGRVHPGQVGFHPENRGGEPPNGERCVSLAKDVLRFGFDSAEADFNGVMVQERPGSTKFKDYNDEACAGSPLLASTVVGLTVGFGSLGHGHLNQILKNVMAGLSMDIKEVSDDGAGTTQVVDRLKKVDATFASYCQTGLYWEILTYKMEEEEPDACNLLQASLNVKNAVAMQTHDMEIIRALTKWCSAEEKAGKNVTFAAAKQKLSVTLGAIVGDPDFLQLFRFVVDLGADNAPYIPDLCEFTSRFVDPKAQI